MNKRQTFLLVLLALLAGAAVYMFRDWFQAKPIQIAYAVRPARPRRNPRNANREPASGKPGYNVIFNFGQRLPLTSVKVFPLEDARTNKYPHAIWNMVSESNSIPTETIIYGGWIRGMHPAVKGARADTLEPGGSYRLVIETAKRKAERDFEIPR